MKIIDYLSKNKILLLYEKIGEYENSAIWNLRAMPILILSLELEKETHGNNRENKLINFSMFNNLMHLYLDKSLPNNLQLILDKYLENLPRFKKGQFEQNEITKELHGYCTMQISRYIKYICKDNNEYIIFKDSWMNTKEKINITNDFFEKYLEKEETRIVNDLHLYKAGNITNFHILKIFLRTPTNSMMDLIYKAWCFNDKSLIEEQKKFIEINTLLK